MKNNVPKFFKLQKKRALKKSNVTKRKLRAVASCILAASLATFSYGSLNLDSLNAWATEAAGQTETLAAQGVEGAVQAPQSSEATSNNETATANTTTEPVQQQAVNAESASTVSASSRPDSNYVGFYTGADGTRHWYENGIIAADKAFYDPDTNAWYWADADGSIATNKDVYIPVSNEDRSQGKWVRFDENSHMIKGEDYRYDAWYYFDEITGEMAKGFKDLWTDGQGKWVCYDRITGQMYHGQANDLGNWYYFDDYTGATQYGFRYIPEDNKWVFYDRITGIMQYGEQCIDGGWYYLTPGTGAVDYGFSYIPTANKWVYYDSVTGRMCYGWCAIDNDWYYFNDITGQSDESQVYRWRMSTASGALGIQFFNGATASSTSLGELERCSNTFYNLGYTLGYIMMDLNTGKGVCCNVDYNFYSASTIKAPYTMAVMSQVFGSNADAASGNLGQMYDILAWSNNEQYAALRNQFGNQPFCDWLSRAGVDASYANSIYTWYSPRVLAKMWLQIYSDMAKGSGGPVLSSFMSNSFCSSIRASINSSVAVRSKAGWTTMFDSNPSTNDAGIVYDPTGNYLVVVLSSAPANFESVQSVVSALNWVHYDMVS